jgi:hypothetical protein
MHCPLRFAKEAPGSSRPWCAGLISGRWLLRPGSRLYGFPRVNVRLVGRGVPQFAPPRRLRARLRFVIESIWLKSRASRRTSQCWRAGGSRRRGQWQPGVDRGAIRLARTPWPQESLGSPRSCSLPRRCRGRAWHHTSPAHGGKRRAPRQRATTRRPSRTVATSLGYVRDFHVRLPAPQLQASVGPQEGDQAPGDGRGIAATRNAPRQG